MLMVYANHGMATMFMVHANHGKATLMFMVHANHRKATMFKMPKNDGKRNDVYYGNIKCNDGPTQRQ